VAGDAWVRPRARSTPRSTWAPTTAAFWSHAPTSTAASGSSTPSRASCAWAKAWVAAATSPRPPWPGRLKICAAKTRRRGVTQLRAVATEACRRAENCDTFLQRVACETGIELEIISNNEEANLAIYGCAPLLDHGVSHALVFDIGGGSTELGWMQVPDEAVESGASGGRVEPGWSR
jgi:hypothetical protein